ncbi:MAG TPA: CHASE3 domain-containing protein, partial [Longimicrobium sp.]|nr:CHASE3 domain-containing protein [Longimicrobium sp.]
MAATFGGTLLVLVFGALAYRGALREDRTRDEVMRSKQVVETVESALIHLLDAETGQRGYLLTGDSSYLEPFARGIAAAPADLDSVSALVRDDPAQRPHVERLVAHVRVKLAELDSTVRLREARGLDGTLPLVRAGTGKTVMDSARDAVDSIRAYEVRRLQLLDARENRYSRNLLFFIVAGTAAAAAVSLLLNQVLVRYGRAQERFAGALGEANARLEEQAAELELQNEQLQEQSAELESQNAQLQEMSDELIERTEAAEVANRAKAKFLAAMSHDLRTPLNAIGGYVDLLAMGIRGPVTEAQAADLQRIRRSSGHLLGMINEILSFARVDAGRVEVRLETVPLEPSLREMEVSFLPQLEERGLVYEFAGAEAPLWVEADPEKLRQVVLNLVTNAIKFTERGGRVWVEAAVDDGHALVRVRDTGRGIPADRLSTIFEPFVQVDRELTDRAHQGVGLGLAISRELARAMGGDL